MSRHTPGPWKITRYSEGGTFPRESAEHFVAIDGPGWGALTRVPIKVDGKANAEGEANALLIAAAPDMLEGLKFYADQQCEGWCEGAAEWAKFEDCSGCKARCLVAQAEGRQA